MKKVYPNRERSGMTMTVSEMIAELQKHDPNMPVLATWESVLAGFRPENFEVTKCEGYQALVIDVEDYG